jgi:hypothetical protein
MCECLHISKLVESNQLPILQNCSKSVGGDNQVFQIPKYLRLFCPIQVAFLQKNVDSGHQTA